MAQNEDCFACVPLRAKNPPLPVVRTLCDEHLRGSETASGDSLPLVIDAINSQLSEGWLEGAPLQWLFGGVSVPARDGDLVRGWTFYASSYFTVAEDRFNASSWLEFWVGDLSLNAPDFRRPALDSLAVDVARVHPTMDRLLTRSAEVGGSEALDAVQLAWLIWSGERKAEEQRASTGRIWPVGDEVFEWVNPPWPWLEHDSAQSFVDVFVTALDRRAERLELL